MSKKISPAKAAAAAKKATSGRFNPMTPTLTVTYRGATVTDHGGSTMMVPTGADVQRTATSFQELAPIFNTMLTEVQPQSGWSGPVTVHIRGGNDSLLGQFTLHYALHILNTLPNLDRDGLAAWLKAPHKLVISGHPFLQQDDYVELLLSKAWPRLQELRHRPDLRSELAEHLAAWETYTGRTLSNAADLINRIAAASQFGDAFQISSDTSAGGGFYISLAGPGDASEFFLYEDGRLTVSRGNISTGEEGPAEVL